MRAGRVSLRVYICWARAATPPASLPRGSSGTLLKGPAGAMGRERARTAEVLMSLEAAQREIGVQRSEIMRLREQVHVLSGGAEGAEGAQQLDGAARPVSSQDRPLKHSPVPQPPRAASADIGLGL